MGSAQAERIGKCCTIAGRADFDGLASRQTGEGQLMPVGRKEMEGHPLPAEILLPPSAFTDCRLLRTGLAGGCTCRYRRRGRRGSLPLPPPTLCGASGQATRRRVAAVMERRRIRCYGGTAEARRPPGAGLVGVSARDLCPGSVRHPDEAVIGREGPRFTVAQRRATSANHRSTAAAAGAGRRLRSSGH